MKIRVQFEPFQTVASVGFWSTLGKRKLDEVRLTTRTLPVWGYWETDQRSGEDRSPKFFLDEGSFSQPPHRQADTGSSPQRTWESGLVVFYETERDFSDMDLHRVCQEHFEGHCAFMLFTLADLKRHLFKYYVAFPAHVPAGPVHCTEVARVEETQGEVLADSSSRRIDNQQVVLGWPARRHLGKARCDVVVVQRPNGRFLCRLDYAPGTAFIPGWESSPRGDVAVRTVDLAPLMDPVGLAKTAADLNLKLIKWQLAPGLDLQRIQSCRCLLFGAGTLGCNVLRGLLGWGIRDLTIVDSGVCSFSNPARQSLITVQDAADRLPKVQAVAKNAALVDPSARIAALQLTIPMPGHLPEADLQQSIDRIDALIQQHDCVFLLTDSRESRWLPTVLCALRSTACFTIALGFDHFVAMQHRPSCYFCQDAVAPVDSVSHRTIDQQCTVSRPGLSMVAAGVGVELMVSTLDPATFGASLPQQVRGSMFSVHEIHGPQSDYCTACSPAVISRCKDNLAGFMRSVFQDSLYLQTVTKLDSLDVRDELVECFE